MAKTLYNTILEAIKNWTKEQKDNTHIQFIMGTLDRVKYDFYHQNYGTIFTANTMMKALKGSNVEFGNDGSITIDRENTKTGSKPKTED